ncbi:hypothetical protein B0H16DRAFT_1736568 [Mycena metata]|uniref:Uncharacterized protein n=1 Tax=Mycena metata TaxID=1033252 RepID=A0AAD7MN32_9AGAR|nr:hypothetical protein B0H16DRAFT_1736568 [Mycena metata]
MLADDSQLAVMVRAPSYNPIPAWELQDRPVGDPALDLQDNDGFSITIRADDDLDDADYISLTESSESAASATDVDDLSDPNNTGGVLRPRGGAGHENPYDPWIGPVHDVDVLLQVAPTMGDPYQVDLRTKIRFKTQPEHESNLGHGYRPQIVSWTNFHVEFSVGVRVGDRDAVSDPDSTLPDIPDLSATSFLIINQTDLWINSDLKSERQGILVLTVAQTFIAPPGSRS